VAYVLGLLFSLARTRPNLPVRRTAPPTRKSTSGRGHRGVLLVAVTVVVALVSEIFVESVQYAATEFGMTPAFVGFIVVAIVGAAAEMMAAFRLPGRTAST